MSALALEQEGRGPPVVLVHGSVVRGRATWTEQWQLAERWTLFVVDRTGFAGGPLPERVDFEAEAALLVDVLGSGPISSATLTAAWSPSWPRLDARKPSGRSP